MKAITTTVKVRNTLKLLVVAVLLVVAQFSSSALATPLSADLQKYPDLMSSDITVHYDALNKLFTADGFVGTYQTDKDTFLYDYFGSSFFISAVIANDGTFSRGTLNIGDTNAPLITGDLQAFGYAGGDPTMQFLFARSGGSLPSSFGPQLFVTLDFSGFDTASNGFAEDFGNGDPGSATSDTQATAVPEPSTVALLLVGLGAAIFVRRRSSARFA